MTPGSENAFNWTLNPSRSGFINDFPAEDSGLKRWKTDADFKFFCCPPGETTKLCFWQKIYLIVKITVKAVGFLADLYLAKHFWIIKILHWMTPWNSSLLIKQITIHNQCMNSNNTYIKMSSASSASKRYMIYYNLTSSNGYIDWKPSSARCDNGWNNNKCGGCFCQQLSMPSCCC